MSIATYSTSWKHPKPLIYLPEWRLWVTGDLTWSQIKVKKIWICFVSTRTITSECRQLGSSTVNAVILCDHPADTGVQSNGRWLENWPLSIMSVVTTLVLTEVWCPHLVKDFLCISGDGKISASGIGVTLTFHTTAGTEIGNLEQMKGMISKQVFHIPGDSQCCEP